MHKKIQLAIGELLDKIGRVNKTEEDLLITERIISSPASHVWVDADVNVSWPVKSLDEVKVVLKEYARSGILLDKFVKSDTTPQWYLKGKNSRIILTPDWYREGTEEEGVNCKMVLMGESVREVRTPIYKLVCDKTIPITPNEEFAPPSSDEQISDEVPF